MLKCRMCCINNWTKNFKTTLSRLVARNTCQKKLIHLIREVMRGSRKSVGGVCWTLEEKYMSKTTPERRSNSKKVYQWQDLQDLVPLALLIAPRLDWSTVDRRHIQY